jgi:hypothetical protein
MAFGFKEFPDGANNYGYIRELRNAIVHRGLNIASAAHFAADVPLLIAPKTIANQSGRIHYKAFSYYVLGLVERCEAVVGPTIEARLNTLGLLERAPDDQEVFAENLAHIERSAAMPDWAKKMSLENIGAVDFTAIHLASIANLRDLLKPGNVEPRRA